MSTILIAPKDYEDIIVLPHPRTDEPCQYLVTRTGKLYEIIRLSTPHKQSLLLTDEIIGVAPIHIATMIDPTFFLIAALRKSATRDVFVEADDIRDLLPTRRLWPSIRPKLDSVCDSTQASGDQYLRLSDEKVRAFVQDKVQRVQDALPTSIVDTLPVQNSLARQKAAFDLVSSYVSAPLIRELTESAPRLYNFDALKVTEKSSFVNPNEFMKRPQSDAEVGGAQGSTGTKKVKKGSKGVEALKKVNTRGMRSMTSFFQKK